MTNQRRGGGERSLLIYALAATYFLVSTCGSMTAVAISLHFAGMEGGENLAAGILVSGACAQIFLSPLLTPVFDRHRPTTVALTASSIELCCLALLCLEVTPPILIAGNLLLSTLTGLTVPAVFTIGDDLSQEGETAETFSLLDTARLVGIFAGPLLGGLLLDVGNLRTALAVEAGAVAISIAAISTVHNKNCPKKGPQGDPSRKRIGFLSSVLEAPSLLLKNKESREALTSIWAAIVFTSIYNVSLVFYATQTLHVNGLTYAVIAQAFVAGRIIGAKFSARVSYRHSRQILMVSGSVMGTCIGIPGLLPSVWLSLVMFFVAGACNALQVASLRITVVSTVMPEIKSKALSAMGSVNNSAMLIGYVIGGPIVAALKPAPSLVVAGLGTIVLTLIPGARRIYLQRRTT